MTNGRTGAVIPILSLLACLFINGCGREVEVFPEPGAASESARVLRSAAAGPIVVAFASYPMQNDAPPDGVRTAVVQAMGRLQCSAAVFFWSEKALAERWLREQIEVRRQYGRPARVILAGHGLGATEAAETAKTLLSLNSGAEIALLLTVDAVKTGRVSSAAGITGAATVGRIPGLAANYTGYDGAPAPDQMYFWSHINYYQLSSPLYHGSPMPYAENHLLSDWTGMLNHGNADDFALPLMTADLRSALERSLR